MEENLALLKMQMLEMMDMVEGQMSKVSDLCNTFDEGQAESVFLTEKHINALEIKIDKDIEHLIALYQPVAVDLRFLMACLKINADLERIADHTERIGQFFGTTGITLPKDFLEELRLQEAFMGAIKMLDHARKALDLENADIARSIFVQDRLLNEINEAATSIVIKQLQSGEKDVYGLLYVLSIVQKIERCGDLVKGVAEEIIFFIEAKVLRHQKKS